MADSQWLKFFSGENELLGQLMDWKIAGATVGSWLILLMFFVLGLILRKIFRRLFRKLIRQVPWSESHPLGVLLGEDLAQPLSWMLILAFWRAALELCSISELVETFFEKGLLIFFSVQFLLLIYQCLNAFGNWINRWAVHSGNALNQQLAPFVSKTAKVIVLGLGVLIALQNLGINVASILAGIGIGSLALALAAQDTAANLFGSVMIILDQPFKVGDHIRVIDTEGIVEEVGFRSTRLRTTGNSLVTIPNSTMAKERIDNLGARTSRRIHHVLGFEYGTAVTQIQQFIEQLRYSLAQNPKVIPQETLIALNSLGDFSLQVRVTFFGSVSTIQEELQLQQDFLLEAYQIAQNLRMNFAFPTQTLFLKKETSV